MRVVVCPLVIIEGLADREIDGAGGGGGAGLGGADSAIFIGACGATFLEQEALYTPTPKARTATIRMRESIFLKVISFPAISIMLFNIVGVPADLHPFWHLPDAPAGD